jgi:hypothetical protein
MAESAANIAAPTQVQTLVLSPNFEINPEMHDIRWHRAEERIRFFSGYFG